jgi:hypothetical protein
MPETAVLLRDIFIYLYIQRGMEWVDFSALIFYREDVLHTPAKRK